MGTYSTEEWNELFGGDPEPGEAYLPLHAADHLRKQARENGLHHHRPLNNLAGEASSSSSSHGSAPPAENPCECCGAPAGVPCASTCEANRA